MILFFTNLKKGLESASGLGFSDFRLPGPYSLKSRGISNVTTLNLLRFCGISFVVYAALPLELTGDELM